MANFRVEYAHRGIKINDVVAHGVQSASLTTSFNLEPVFELGQLDIYENLETLPEVQLTIEKVLDGYPLILELATGAAASDTLIDRTNQQCDIEFFIYPDSQSDADSADATTVAAMLTLEDLYVSSITYNLQTDGNFTESITFVGNDKVWATTPDDFIPEATFGSDSPADTVKRRQHINMGDTVGTSSIWPTQIQGINGSGYNVLSSDEYAAHMGDISISVNLNREDFFEQGRRKPYYKRASFPTAVDTTINVNAGGTDPGDGIDADSDATNNLVDNQIVIRLSDGTVFDLGSSNKILSVTESGGSTGGEALSYAYALQTYNTLTVTSPPQS